MNKPEKIVSIITGLKDAQATLEDLLQESEKIDQESVDAASLADAIESIDTAIDSLNDVIGVA